MNTIQTHFWAVRDYLAPVLRESKFKEHGRITPEEFVAAGDFLSYKFPTWTWSAATSSDAKYTRDFLPTDKQYLVSRGVPCLRRVSQMERAALGTASTSSKGDAKTAADELVLNFGEGHHGEEVQGKGSEEDWLATHVEDDNNSAGAQDIADIPDIDASGAALTAGEEDDLANRVANTSLGQSSGSGADANGNDNGIGDIPDMDDEDEDELGGLGAGVEEADDPAVAKATQAKSALAGGSTNNKLVSVRTYDCLITYDKYYQTPRMWLVGYNENGQPLRPFEIFEDVSSDYAQKTVTVEPFPHGNMSTASIHPCKHANVMKKVIERMNASVVEEQRRAIASKRGTSGAASTADAAKKKRGWGLSGAMKKVTGGKDASSGSGPTADSTAGADEASADDGKISAGEPEGLRVDQYLLIFLKFMASIVPAIEIDATQAM